MKIAVSTEDQKTICGHLGRCSTFIVYDLENCEIVSRETREVTPVHGADETYSGHRGVIDALMDTSAVITNGMGAHFASALHAAGIDPVVTQERDPDTAVRAYIEGSLLTKEGCCECGGEH